MNKLLKLRPPSSVHKSDMSIWTLWLVYIEQQQSHTNLSVCSIQCANNLVSFFRLIIYVYGHRWNQHRGHIFFSTKGFRSNHPLFSQLHELVEIYLSHCNIVDKAKVSDVVSLEHFKCNTQVIGVIFGPRNFSKPILTSSKVTIICTNWLVQGNVNVVSLGWKG